MKSDPMTNSFNEEYNFVKQEHAWILRKDEYEATEHSFRSLDEIRRTIKFFNPETIGILFGPRSKVPHGFVCIHDAYAYLREAKWLLLNAFCYFMYLYNAGKARCRSS